MVVPDKVPREGGTGDNAAKVATGVRPPHVVAPSDRMFCAYRVKAKCYSLPDPALIAAEIAEAGSFSSLTGRNLSV